jgi:hypothetical protein
MESKPISQHLKKIVDNLVEKHGIDWCIARAYKLNDMNKQLLEGHKADGEKAEAMKVARDISVNEKATEYLNELLKTKQDDK